MRSADYPTAATNVISFRFKNKKSRSPAKTGFRIPETEVSVYQGFRFPQDPFPYSVIRKFLFLIPDSLILIPYTLLFLTIHLLSVPFCFDGSFLLLLAYDDTLLITS